MTIPWTDVNPWAVLVSVVANMATGAVWYSKAAFGKAWIELTGIRPEDVKGEEIQKSMMLAILASGAQAYALAVLLAWTGAPGLLGGLLLGLFTALAIVAPSEGKNQVFEGRRWKFFALTAGQHAVGYAAMGTILGSWR